MDSYDDQDVVVSFETIEHTRDPDIQVRHYYRILRPGGAVFISTPNYNSLSRLLLGAECRIFGLDPVWWTPGLRRFGRLGELRFVILQPPIEGVSSYGLAPDRGV